MLISVSIIHSTELLVEIYPVHLVFTVMILPATKNSPPGVSYLEYELAG